MKIIEIKPLGNGAHRNQSGNMRTVPEGWAVIPAEIYIPESFPFVDIVVENGVVTAMTAREVPAPEPQPPAPKTAEERIADLENALCDMDAANEEAHATYETALCDLDEAMNGGTV